MRYEYLGRDRQSNRGFFSSLVRGVWMPLCPLQSIPSSPKPLISPVTARQ